MTIDFVVVGKIDSDNRHKLLMQSFNSLEKNTDPSFIHRIVYVDDLSAIYGNSWFDEGIMRELMGLKNIVVVRNDKQLGVGGSKNRGVEINTNMGRGDLLYMMDADVYFTEGWLDKLLKLNERYKEFKIIAGGVHPYLQPRINEGDLGITSHDAVSGWSWLLSYDTWDRFGTLADNSLGTGKSEDWEYCQRIRNQGFKVGCAKPQVIAHCGLTNTEGNKIVGYEESLALAKRVAGEAILL